MNRCAEPVPDWMPLTFGCPKAPGHQDEHLWMSKAYFTQVLNCHHDDVKGWLAGDKVTTHAPWDCHPGCLSYEPESEWPSFAES